MRDIDGARTVEFEVRGGSVFMWGTGFSYEFDRGILAHQLGRMLGLEPKKALPEGSALCMVAPCVVAALA